MTTLAFDKLGLNESILSALTDLGYEEPTPIQEQGIPVLLQGKDIIAQAQTGTGKTAAFALPALSQLDFEIKSPQVLVIVPTRELAIQVAEAFQSYAKHLTGFHITPIYGGQDYVIQLRSLRRNPQVIVGTPGRTMDHLRRGTLKIEELKTVVLDEGDEMLRMGFIDDVEWILEQIKGSHQTALFSATMPASIQKISQRYLKNAVKINIKAEKNTVDNITQFYTRVSRNQKLDVLTRFLEVEETQAVIIFTRTKNCSAELAEKLQARGYAAAALNGDVKQSMRKSVIDRIKSGALDIIVATDLAARGIDVDRVTHVINYDIPHDTESYTHRIGRTGRAGRSGKAILFITPRETRMLQDIERSTQKKIEQIFPPSLQEMQVKRSKQLMEKVVGVIEKSKKLEPFHEVITEIMSEHNYAAKDVAAALAYLIQQADPMPTEEIKEEKRYDRRDDTRSRGSHSKRGYSDRRSGSDRRFSSDRRSSGGGRSDGRRSEGGGSEGRRSAADGRRSEGGGSEGRRFEGRRSEGGGNRSFSSSKPRGNSRSGGGSSSGSGRGSSRRG